MERDPMLALVLHAHLPYVRHPEHEEFLEERWLFEAIAECYLPLIGVLEGWERDGVGGVLNLTVSPTLAAMLSDPLLCGRFGRHLERLCGLAGTEVERHLLQPEWARVAAFHGERFREVAAVWERIGGNVLGAWRRHAEAGRLELMTCAATHALLPLLVDTPGALRGQVRTAVAEHRRHFGREPGGIWLPECAYAPGIESELAAAGLRWFVVETHGLLLSRPPAPKGVFAPVLTSHGLAAFGRDPSSARQVWSRKGGYPGDPRYREFHADLSDEAEWGYLAPHVAGTGVRVPTGIKYHRVTGGDGVKALYDPAAAGEAVREHAAHFVGERARQLRAAARVSGEGLLSVSPYDAELFGHWWFEGPDFVDAVVRRVASGGTGLRMTGLGEYLGEWGRLAVCEPAVSSWGEQGHLGVWLDEVNAWMQRPLRRMARRMAERLAEGGAGEPGSVRWHFLSELARELMLAQASDWPFLIRMGTAREYARRRFDGHCEAFASLDAAGELLVSGEGRERAGWRQGLFPGVDPAWWA